MEKIKSILRMLIPKNIDGDIEMETQQTEQKQAKKPDWVARMVAIAGMVAILLIALYVQHNIEYVKQSPCKVCEEQVKGMQCTPMVRGQMSPQAVQQWLLEPINLSPTNEKAKDILTPSS